MAKVPINAPKHWRERAERARTVSHLALIGLRPPVGSLHQYGIRPQRSGSSETSPVW
jgi:hypothetical protein